MPGWLSYRHRKSNHLWQRRLLPLHDGSAQDYAPRSLEPNRSHPLSQSAAIVSLLTSFLPPPLSLRCVRELLLLPPRPPKTLLHRLTRGRSFPPPGPGPSSFASPGGAALARAERHRERRGESRGARVSFKTFVSPEPRGLGSWLIGVFSFGHKPHSCLSLLSGGKPV